MSDKKAGLFFPAHLELRLDWGEMDVLGHINNVMYFKYLQAARVQYWETIGLSTLGKDVHIGPTLANTSCNFIKPLFYPDSIRIESRMEFIKTTSFGLHHCIFNSKNELVAEGHDVVVLYDFKNETKFTIPTDLRERIHAFENLTS
ncbi:MAG: acyl-CoA thioesterase [Bacteroidia bacterium]